ncbi:TPR-like protein, partial [Tilletiaria anomala UBC 951]
ARAVREQGNAAYASGDYQEATEHYTRAIGYDATEAIFPLNRAACLLKLKKFAEAERDCSAALALDPHNHKAYFRRGVSRAAL